MQTSSQRYTTDQVFASLGYPDPMVAARQQARMILLGRRSRYQAEMRQIAQKWGCTLEELRARYTDQDNEDFESDDDYVQWQWFADATEAVDAQLAVLVE